MSIISLAKRYIPAPNSNYISYASDISYPYKLSLYDGNSNIYIASSVTVWQIPIISNPSPATQYAGATVGVPTPGATTCNQVPYEFNQFYSISSLVMDGSSNLYVGDTGGVVQVFAPSGSAACNVVMCNVTAMAVNSAGTQILGLSNSGSNIVVYSNSVSGTAPFNSSWSSTVSISMFGLTTSGVALFLSYAPAMGTGGTFFTGSGGTPPDYIIQSITSISGSGATLTPYTVDGFSNVQPAVGGVSMLQILSAHFDGSNNAYVITKPLGSQSNATIGIRYMTYTASSTTFTSVTLGTPVATKFTGYITSGSPSATLTLSSPSGPLPIANTQFITGPGVPAGAYIFGGSGQTAGSTWTVYPSNVSVGSSGSPVAFVNYFNTIFATGSNSNIPKPYLPGGTGSNPVFYIADGTIVREYLVTY
jgi:hypothetical protein